MNEDQRMWATFNTLQSVHMRLKILERRQWINKAASAVGGFAGGICAFLGFRWWG